MDIHNDVTLERVMTAVEEDDNLGFCTSCGEEVHGVEPDARGYDCEYCESPTVYGAQELLMELAL